MSLLNIIFLISFAFSFATGELATKQKSERLLGVSSVNVKRGAVRSSKLRWPASVEGGKTIIKIPYIVSGGLGDKAAKELERAIQDLHEATCVRFRPWSGEADFVSFELGSACLSVIGRQAGRQVVYLGPGCENKGTILHELLHLLGFYHEHNRADRDTYLRIYEQNIADAYRQGVMKTYGADMMENLGFQYDLHSIMQYGRHAFAKSPKLVTMEAWSNPNMELGNRNAMSAADIMKINKLYYCDERKDVYKDMEVTIQTGDGWFDGTNSFLYLELIGDGGKKSGESSVGKGGYYDDFESDQTDRYLVAFKDVGTIRQLKIRLQENPNGGYFGGWTFSKIIIKDGSSTYTFNGQGLGSGQSVTVPPYCHWECRIKGQSSAQFQGSHREIENNAYTKFWMDNKEYYGIFEKGLYN